MQDVSQNPTLAQVVDTKGTWGLAACAQGEFHQLRLIALSTLVGVDRRAKQNQSKKLVIIPCRGTAHDQQDESDSVQDPEQPGADAAHQIGAAATWRSRRQPFLFFRVSTGPSARWTQQSRDHKLILATIHEQFGPQPDSLTETLISEVLKDRD